MDLGRMSFSSTWLFAAALLLAVLPPAQAEDARPAAPQAAGIPVSVAKAARQDVPLVIRGLGTVQAYNSVLVRPQVDGQLVRIAVTEGQDVKKGDLLAVIDTRSYQAALDQARAKRQQDQAQLSNAQADLARYSSLAQQNFASRQQVETQQAQVKQFTAAIAGDDALIEVAQVNLGYCAITAPFDGRVGLRTVDPGNFIRAAEATPIMPLAQIHPISVVFTVPQDFLPDIQRALAAGKPPVLAFASDDKTQLDQGELLTVDNAIDAATGTIKAKATFPNAANALWPGQFVNTRLQVGTLNGIVIPSAAVLHGQDRLYVYVVKDDLTVEARTVEVARDDGVRAVIAKGLDDGVTVVTDGYSRLKNGIRVAITGAAPARLGG
jgi:membrane fusion protein, multidrug efflux system